MLFRSSAKVVHHSRNENELNSVPAFNGIGGQEDDEDLVGELGDEEDDYSSYEDEPTGNENNEWGSDFDNSDVNEIVSIEKHHGGKPNSSSGRDRDDYVKKPQMGKCCKMGEGLNSQGQCKPHPRHHQHRTEMEMQHQHHSRHANHSVWFPQKIFHIEKGTWTVPNVNEWNITVGHYVQCPENESSELISDIDKFAITNHGNLFVIRRENKEVEELDFCVDLLLGETPTPHLFKINTFFTIYMNFQVTRSLLFGVASHKPNFVIPSFRV